MDLLRISSSLHEETNYPHFYPFLSFTLSSYACTCSSLETTSNKYQQSDFVGIIKIVKTYKNEVGLH
jgi:hypothetical protein